MKVSLTFRSWRTQNGETITLPFMHHGIVYKQQHDGAKIKEATGHAKLTPQYSRTGGK